MASWRKTKTPGVYVAHLVRCPAQEGDDARCRCTPSWRGRRRNPLTGKAEWQTPVVKDRNEVLGWLAAGVKGAPHLRARSGESRTFESIGDEWIGGVEAGRIGRRKGRGKPYSATTIRDYRRSYWNFVRPEFGPMPADGIGEVEWQMWVDELSREGLSRSRIATHVAVASAIYAWAMVPSRRYATTNPLRVIELPPNDEKPRLRVAFAPEAERLLAALEPKDAVPYAIAFYAGLRRAEIHRLEWPEVLDGKRIASRLLVLRAKSEAGRERRPPIAKPLQAILRRAWLRQGGAWHHVAITKSGGNVSFYLDGAPIHSGTGAASATAAMPWHIMRNGTYAQYANGNADEVAVYDRALPASTIAQHHQTGQGH